jgi:hypothetical protein
MRKIIFPLLAIFLLQSCASAQNTPEPTPTATVTFTPASTSTPAFTSLPTASPTIIRIPTQDFNATPTIVNAIPIYVGSVTATFAPNVLTAPAGPGAGFVKVEVSPNTIFWGGCEQNKAVIKTEVEDPDQTAGVIIFTRVKDIKEEDYTPWTSGNVMLDNRDGTYTYIAIGSEIQGHNHYKQAYVYFQLVAVDDEGKEIGRTKVYEKAFSMIPCPCLTPITGCPLPTAKKP